MKCGCESYKNGKLVGCEEVGIWMHPRYPNEAICQNHKELLELCISPEWTKVEEKNSNRLQ